MKTTIKIALLTIAIFATKSSVAISQQHASANNAVPISLIQLYTENEKERVNAELNTVQRYIESSTKKAAYWWKEYQRRLQTRQPQHVSNNARHEYELWNYEIAQYQNRYSHLTRRLNQTIRVQFIDDSKQPISSITHRLNKGELVGDYLKRNADSLFGKVNKVVIGPPLITTISGHPCHGTWDVNQWGIVVIRVKQGGRMEGYWANNPSKKIRGKVDPNNANNIIDLQYQSSPGKWVTTTMYIAKVSPNRPNEISIGSSYRDRTTGSRIQ